MFPFKCKKGSIVHICQKSDKQKKLIGKFVHSWLPLLSITHECCKQTDDELEVKKIFLDNSRAFDKVWRKEIIFKLEHGVTSGEF